MYSFLQHSTTASLQGCQGIDLTFLTIEELLDATSGLGAKADATWTRGRLATVTNGVIFDGTKSSADIVRKKVHTV